MMAKSNITQSLKSNIATPFIGQNGGPRRTRLMILKCCSVTFVVGTNVKKHFSGFPKVMSFKILNNNNKHKIDT